MGRGGRHTAGARRLAALVLLTGLVLRGTVVAQPAATDPVERLRAVLRTTTEDPARRAAAAGAAAARLRALGELRHAYTLPEWRDRTADEELARVDRELRTALAERFAATFRDVLRGGDAAQSAEAVAQLAELAAAVRAGGEDPGAWFTQDLVRLARQGPPPLRAGAARALAQTAPLPVAVPALAALLKDSDGGLRRTAAEALADLLRQATQSAAAASQGVAPADRSASASAAAQVLAALGPGLGDWFPDVRRRCAGATGAAAAALGRLVPEPGGGASPAAALAELRPLALALRALLPALARALRDTDPEVRLAAQKALEEVALARGRWIAAAPADDPLLDGLKATVPALADAVADPEVRVRRAVIDVLELLGPVAAPAVPALTRALGDRDRFVRWSAVRALGALGPTARPAVPALTRLLEDADPDIRLAAARALERIGPAGRSQAGAAPVERMSYRPAAGPSSEARTALPALMRSLRASDAQQRLAALRALRGLGPEARPAVPALCEALADPHARVRRAAAEALAAVGPPARAAAEALRAALADPDAEVRKAAGDALLAIVRPD